MELRSAEWNELAAALAKAQGAMENAEKNAANPHFKSKYADLGAVRDASIPALSANGIALVQQVRRDLENGGLLLTTMLIHSSGQWLASELPVPHLQRVQELGSYLTYARRYSWMGLVGVAPADDDDGELANKATATVAAPGPRRPPPPAKNVMLTADGEVVDEPQDDRQMGLVTRTVHLQEVEKVLERAASQGMLVLETAWKNLDAAERKHFKNALERRFKPQAEDADALLAEAQAQDESM